jgi:polyadenylate-binding protein
MPSLTALQPQYSPSPPPRSSPYARNTPLQQFVHGPGQQVQPAAPGTSHSGLIDPCNLFCKDLDLSIDSNGLFSHFRRVGVR